MSDNETFGYADLWRRYRRPLTDEQRAKRIAIYFNQSPAEVEREYRAMAERMKQSAQERPDS